MVMASNNMWMRLQGWRRAKLRLVVACPPAVVESNDGPKHLIPPLSNYITQEQPKEPTFQRRSKRVVSRSFTQGAILTAVELTKCKLNPAKLAQQIFPEQLICELAGAVMDKNGDMPKY